MGVLLELADRIRITPYTARQTREAERERTRTIATLEAKVAQHLKRIESYGYGENYLDPMEQYRDGGELWYPTGYGVSGSANDRKGGQSWPFLFNEFQLQKMRGAARVLCDSNPFAIGARDRHCDFVVGDGMKPQVTLRGTKPGSVASGGNVALAVKAVQDVIDEWRELNSWGAGPWIGDIADPNDDAGYIGNKEREGYERAVVDGEVAVRFFAGGSSERGLPRIRWIEPELIVTPPGENITGPKGWGIETDPDDIERKLSYYVQGHEGIEGEYVESGRVVYGKLNTVSTVKRGVSDFAPVGPMLTRTLKLMDAMGEVSAILAQIAYLREHAPGTTSAQVSTMIGGAKDFDKSRRGGSYTTIPAQYQEPGTVHDVSNGMKYVAPPMQSGAPGFIQVEQAMLRAIGQRWGMPEFFSGDASNNNYASIAVTGSPFERAVKSRQQWYMSFQRAIYYKVIAYAVKSGRLSADDARAVEITLVPTTASATDSLKEAQRKEILNRAKVLSPQTWASQEGLDAAQETSNLQAHDEAFPDGGMNAGGMFDFGGGQPQRTPEPTLPESVQEGFTDDEYQLLSEADRTHLVRRVITNRKGKKQVVWVRATGDAGEKTRQHIADSRTLLAKAIANPNSLNPEQFAALGEHLMTVNRDELRNLAKQIGEKVGGDKQAIADRLAAKVKAGRDETKTPGAAIVNKLDSDIAKKKRRSVAAKKAAETRIAKAMGGKDTIAWQVRKSGGINPNDPDFHIAMGGAPLRDKYGKKKVDKNGNVIYNTFHKEWGVNGGIFNKKSNRGFDVLAEELQNDGYLHVPEGMHATDALADALKGHAKTQHDEFDQGELRARHDAMEMFHTETLKDLDNHRDEMGEEEYDRLIGELDKDVEEVKNAPWEKFDEVFFRVGGKYHPGMESDFRKVNAEADRRAEIESGYSDAGLDEWEPDEIYTGTAEEPGVTAGTYPDIDIHGDVIARNPKGYGRGN